MNRRSTAYRYLPECSRAGTAEMLVRTIGGEGVNPDELLREIRYNRIGTKALVDQVSPASIDRTKPQLDQFGSARTDRADQVGSPQLEPEIDPYLLFAQYELFRDPPQWAPDERMIGSSTSTRYGVKWDKGWILPIRDPYTHILLGSQLKRLDFVSNYPKRVKKSETLFGLDAICMASSDGGVTSSTHAEDALRRASSATACAVAEGVSIAVEIADLNRSRTFPPAAPISRPRLFFGVRLIFSDRTGSKVPSPSSKSRVAGNRSPLLAMPSPSVANVRTHPDGDRWVSGRLRLWEKTVDTERVGATGFRRSSGGGTFAPSGDGESTPEWPARAITRRLGDEHGSVKRSGLIGMSMYQRFLGMALDETADVDDDLTVGAAVAQLLLCRRQLRNRDDDPDASSDIASALGEELDYDIALLRLARLLGIQVDVEAFDRPRVERSRLEQVIEVHGIRLGDLDT